ncbi:hypothetical protein BS50DRAFT_573505 [Corynespora cassiicola Philippines]|uniref:TEA domain-containing protein n=1 Tax=Corynespora cassiicola Philippines TaxID=1448308 RepID=A0A2T2NMT6_CORCC|nr:hypothetical protein BS50DRAFT_573505 [Corynespora cassiicola Philippines]
MSGKDKSLARKRQANLQLRVRNPAGTLTAKYEFSQPEWPGQHLSASLPLEVFLPNASDEQFTVSDFSMFVEAAEQRVHDFTRLTGDSRIGDINVSDLQPWRQQYPEFKFVTVDEFKQRHVIVCDASIKVMTEKLPVASSLIIPFYVQSKNNLEIFESLECRTRFYDKTYDHVQLVTQPIKGQEAKEAKETRTDCEYFADTGSVKLRFGSTFWAHRMQKCSMEIREAGKARMRDDRDDANRKETYVRQLLRNMTAVQDVYGTRKGAEDPVCFLTILWRFSQTRTAHEPGKITWRVVNFEGSGAYGTTIVNQQWAQAQAQAQEEDEGEDDEDENMKIISRNMAAAIPGSMPAAVYSPLQSVEFHQTFGTPPLQLDLDSLSTLASFETMTDFSNPSSATFSAEYSQSQSLPALSHSQETIAGPSQQYPHDASDYDFHGGQITIAGCLEPSIGLAAYEQFATHPQSIQALDALAGLEPGHHQDDSTTLLGFGLSVGAGCYPAKPSWHHPDLISRFEGMAEQQNLFGQTAHGDDIAGHGVLHDGQLNPGLWKLQTSFPDDSGISMDHGPKDNHLPREQGDVILEMIERDQQKESQYRPF